MEFLLRLDKDLFLWVNSLHTTWLDPVMFWFTKTIAWLPLYAFLLYLLIKHDKKQTWIVLFRIAITILLAHLITSGFMKPFFQRFRPSHEPSLEDLVHLVNGHKSEKFGFASSHAANTFGVALFFFLHFSLKFKWIKCLFIWAAFMCYTRIYLGLHYPGDIVVGACVGALSGWMGHRAYTLLLGKLYPLHSDKKT